MSKFRDFEKYEVYPDGRIYSYKRNKFLKPETTKFGYQRVALTDNNGILKRYYVHRIVWEAVTGTQIPEGYEINHRNEIKTDNRFFENLELVSHKENINYGTRTIRSSKTRSKQVGAFKNGELVFTFSSTKEAGRQGFDQGAVAACCRNCFNREGNNVYKGYTWKYINEKET